MFISLIIGIYAIQYLCALNIFQIIRFDGPQSHILKKNTPVMGGVVILISIISSVIMCADLSNWYVWCVLLMLIAYGILGIVDDLLKITRKNSNGLSVLYKYFWQSLIAITLILSIFIVNKDVLSMKVVIPFINIVPELGVFWYVVLAYFVVVGASNAVNLSDGLDGLVIMPIIFIAIGLALIAYVTNSEYYSNCLHIPYVYGSGELVIVCVAIIGAGLGFLWFNAYPAQIFMGDVGALSLGGGLGIIAVFLHQECLLLIMGGVFVVETISVIFQVGYFKLFKQRIFKMAPIHHHCELQGCPEPKIVVRIWIISLVLVLIGLIILIMR